MTQTAHTPGPWDINKVNDHCIQIRAKKGNTEFECSTAVLGGWDTTAQENEANARLIAAAPDLLEALRAILLNDRAAGALTDALSEQACAAIARATQE